MAIIIVSGGDCGDGVFRYFRPSDKGTFPANVSMNRDRGNRLFAEGLADLVAFGRPDRVAASYGGLPRMYLLPKRIERGCTPRDHAAIPMTPHTNHHNQQGADYAKNNT
jgi:hypothetical protein